MVKKISSQWHWGFKQKKIYKVCNLDSRVKDKNGIFCPQNSEFKYSLRNENISAEIVQLIIALK